ncbi:MAG: UPF0489 family protein [Clostridia bacterium]|nr:UPF0489 family protein [Clostridia bacterium]MBR0444485.1 UPF0489 family protein [Clostridia bacterium]
MRLLDIDLDFFLNDCCPLSEPGTRPELPGHEPWPEARVRSFLEYNCGLEKSHKLRGAVFETHDRALSFWMDRIRSGELTVPFQVTHIDAHSDLGIGYPGPGYVLNGVLPQRVDVRPDLEKYYRLRQLDEANYLLFALSFRWISLLENVRNPKSRADIPPQILVPGRSDRIRLRSFASDLMEAANGPEPEIPFLVYDDPENYRTSGTFDFVTLAVSPRYAPEEADALIPLISEYMCS